jgi:hypothetical protein
VARRSLECAADGADDAAAKMTGGNSGSRLATAIGRSSAIVVSGDRSLQLLRELCDELLRRLFQFDGLIAQVAKLSDSRIFHLQESVKRTRQNVSKLDW